MSQRVVVGFLTVIIVNIVGLWTYILIPKKYLDNQPSLTQPSSQQQDSQEVEETHSYSNELDGIKKSLDDIDSRIQSLETAETPNLGEKVPENKNAPLGKLTLHENYISFGSGETTNTFWTDLPHTAISINFDNYGKVDKAVFEATLSILGGEAQARLINKTTGAVIDVSEVSHNANVYERKTSGAIPIISGGSEYMIQLRSTSGEIARLGEARLRIEAYR